MLQSGEQHADKRNLGGETALCFVARLNKRNAVRIARLLVQARVLRAACAARKAFIATLRLTG